MKYDPNKHHRQSIRLRDYDYAQAGAYFITICAHDRRCLFGDVIDGEMRLNGLGLIVVESWDALPNHYPHIELGYICSYA
jgi:putative transposase